MTNPVNIDGCLRPLRFLGCIMQAENNEYAKKLMARRREKLAGLRFFFSDGQELTDMEPQNPAGRGAGQAKAKPGGRGAGRLTDFLVVDRGDFVQREVEEGRGIHVAGLLHAVLHRVAAIHRGRDESEDRRSCAPLKPTTREAGGQSKAIQNPKQRGQAGSRLLVSSRAVQCLRGGNATPPGKKHSKLWQQRVCQHFGSGQPTTSVVGSFID